MKPTIGLVMLAGLFAAQPGSAANLSRSDSTYITETAQGLMFELKLGALAQERASDPRVKDCQPMVADHGKDLEELKALAAKKAIKPPQAMDKDQRKEAGKALATVTGHKEKIDALRALAK